MRLNHLLITSGSTSWRSPCQYFQSDGAWVQCQELPEHGPAADNLGLVYAPHDHHDRAQPRKRPRRGLKRGKGGVVSLPKQMRKAAINGTTDLRHPLVRQNLVPGPSSSEENGLRLEEA